MVEQISLLTAERDFFRLKWSDAAPDEARELNSHFNNGLVEMEFRDGSNATDRDPEHTMIINDDMQRAIAGHEGIGRQKDSIVSVMQSYNRKIRELQDKLTESELARKLQAPMTAWSPGRLATAPTEEDILVETDLAESFAKVIVRAQRQIKEDERRIHAYTKKAGSGGELDDVLSAVDDDVSVDGMKDMEVVDNLDVVYKKRQKDLSTLV